MCFVTDAILDIVTEKFIFFVFGSFFSLKIIFCRSDRTIRSIKHHLRTKGIKGVRSVGYGVTRHRNVI